MSSPAEDLSALVVDDHDVMRFVCPLSFEVMRDPVRATATGELFDAQSLERYRADRRERGEDELVSPLDAARAMGEIQPASDVLAQLRLVLRGRQERACGTDEALATPDTTRARTLTDIAAIFECLDVLRPELGDVLQGWAPPRVVVVGFESTGKSTLLERLAHMPLFPRANRTCTRVPIHLRLRRCAPSDSHARLTVFNSGEREPAEPGRVIAIENGWERVQEEMERLLCGMEGGASGVRADKTILLTVYHSRVPSIDLVDLPGIQISSDGGRERTEGIVRQQLERPDGCNDMYLLVQKWSAKCRTDQVGGLNCMNEARRARTVGVLTHCDEIEPTSQRNRAHLRAILSREPSAQAVADLAIADLRPHGWVAIASGEEEDSPVSRGGLDRLMRMARTEREHFAAHAELQQLVDEGAATCDALVSRLETMYHQVLVQQWMPETLARLDELAGQCHLRLERLGNPAQPTDAEARAEVERLLGEGYAQLLEDSAGPSLRRLHTAMLSVCSHDGPFPLRERRTVHSARLLSIEHERFVRALVADSVADAHAHLHAGLAKILQGQAEGGLRLARFPVYVQASIDALGSLLNGSFARAAASCSQVLDRVFDPLDGGSWLRWEVHHEGPSVRVCICPDGSRIADGLLRACALALPELEPMLEAQAGVALGAEREACAAEREEQVATRMRALRTATELHWGLRACGMGGPGDAPSHAPEHDRGLHEAVRRARELAALEGHSEEGTLRKLEHLSLVLSISLVLSKRDNPPQSNEDDR